MVMISQSPACRSTIKSLLDLEHLPYPDSNSAIAFPVLVFDTLTSNGSWRSSVIFIIVSLLIGQTQSAKPRFRSTWSNGMAFTLPLFNAFILLSARYKSFKSSR